MEFECGLEAVNFAPEESPEISGRMVAGRVREIVWEKDRARTKSLTLASAFGSKSRPSALSVASRQARLRRSRSSVEIEEELFDATAFLYLTTTGSLLNCESFDFSIPLAISVQTLPQPKSLKTAGRDFRVIGRARNIMRRRPI